MPTGVYLRPVLSNYTKDTKTNCWNWAGKLRNNGYGQHKYYYEKFVGRVKDGLTLDHTCRNKACVNPSHLEVVSIKENIRRSSKLDYRTISKIKNLYKSGYTQVKIGRLVGISQSHVSRIINHKRWN